MADRKDHKHSDYQTALNPQPSTTSFKSGRQRIYAGALAAMLVKFLGRPADSSGRAMIRRGSKLDAMLIWRLHRPMPRPLASPQPLGIFADF
jgi:hypothetical protein